MSEKFNLLHCAVALWAAAAAAGLSGCASNPGPIGVFDSGIGGMTVLEKMLTMDLYDNASYSVGVSPESRFRSAGARALGDPLGDAGRNE